MYHDQVGPVGAVLRGEIRAKSLRPEMLLGEAASGRHRGQSPGGASVYSRSSFQGAWELLVACNG